MPTENFYITTPIYYVNAEPHIGHAYTTILADVVARYNMSILNKEVFFLTGTDEHGSKVEEAARKNNISPIEQCNITSERFKKLWNKLNVSYDYFIRTTENKHESTVMKILTILYETGMIYKSKYSGWYCVSCERFFTDKDLEDDIDNKKCLLCGKSLEEIEEDNYFFRMSLYHDWLIDYIKNHPNFILPIEKANETLGFLKKPLNDLCISRPKNRVKWGIELPFDDKYVSYVWVDALINYLSGIHYLDNDKKNIFKKWWPASIQLMAKDILIAHTIYWTIILKALNLKLPNTIFVHGWWLIDSEKMSKSSKNAINPMDLIDKFGVDAFRYFLISDMTPGHDANFSEEIFIRRYNSDLVNNIGNFVSRVFKFLTKYRDGIIPLPDNTLPDNIFRNLKDNLFKFINNSNFLVQNMELNKYVNVIVEMIKSGNEYIEIMTPWKLLSQSGDNAKRLDTIMYNLVEFIRIIFSLLYPVMPNTSKKIINVININTTDYFSKNIFKWGMTQSGSKIVYDIILFPRIDR